jgi:teichuronic acid biosynthesis glycosyltransferase TuaH
VRVVMLSHTSRLSVFRVGSHHLAREFSALGHRVVHISNPIAAAHLLRLHDSEVRRRFRMAVPLRLHSIDGALFGVPWSLFPLTPDPLAHPVSLGSTRVLLRALKDADCAEPDLMFVDQPLLSHLIEPIAPRTVIYRPTDITVDRLASAAQRKVLGQAAGVIATSQTVLDDIGATGFSGPAAVVAIGVDLRVFGAPGSADWEQRSGAVYVGALDNRFDWNAVIDMAWAEPDHPVDIYGPRSEPPPELPPNVAVRGPVDYADVPKILRSHRVGLLPLNRDPTNDGRSPMKLFEYLASGLAVVARATPALLAHGLADVHTYEAAHDAGSILRTAHAAPPSPAGRAAADTMSWPSRARLVLEAATVMASGTQAPTTAAAG